MPLEIGMAESDLDFFEVLVLEYIEEIIDSEAEESFVDAINVPLDELTTNQRMGEVVEE